MKKNDEKKANLFYQAMGEIDINILKELEEMELKLGKANGIEKRKAKKKKILIGALVGCTLLMGAGTGLMRQFAGGIVFEWKNSDKINYSLSADSIVDKVYEEREDGLYYIFEGAELNITEYCSDTDYFLAPVLDELGNGYVMVVGGDEGERGFLLKHFDFGEFFIGQEENEIFIQDVSTYRDYIQGATSNYPQLIWNHHATHFLGKNLSEDFYGSDLPDIIETEYGVAEQVGENVYHVQGEKLGVYSIQEQENYIMKELMWKIDWITGLGADGSDGEVIKVRIDEDWTQEREREARELLEEIGFSYQLEFRVAN